MFKWEFRNVTFKTEYFDLHAKKNHKLFDWLGSTKVGRPTLTLKMPSSGRLTEVKFQRPFKQHWTVVFKDLTAFNSNHLREITYILDKLNCACVWKEHE